MDNNSVVEPKILNDQRGEVKEFSKPAIQVPQNIQNSMDYEVRTESKKKRKFISLRGIFKVIRVIGCWLPIILIILAIAVILTRPTLIWGNITTFLNSGLQVPTNHELSEDTAKAEINSQLESVGNNEVIINESQLLGLTKEKLNQLKELKVDIEREEVTFIWILDKTNEQKPLYGIIQLRVDNENNLSVSKVGTNRVSIPEFLNKAITESLLTVSNIQGTENQNNLLYTILPFDKNIEINSVILEKDQLKLNVNLKAGLF